MKNSTQTLLSFTILFLLSIGVTGCAEHTTTEYLVIKKGPPPEIVAEGGVAKTIPAGFIKRRIRLGMPSAKNVGIGDRQYIYVTEKWFRDVIQWTEEFISLEVPDLDLAINYPLGYEETFAVLASNFANIAVARKYNLRASVLMGLVTAKHEKPWGVIPADGKTGVYILGLTEKGGVIYDVRSKQLIGFEQFPNFDSIRSVFF